MPRRSKLFAPLFAGLFATVVLAAVAGRGARADDSSCPTGNLLAGKLPSATSDLRREPRLMTDGQVGQEGAIWDATVAVVLDTAAATVTYDLGRPTGVQALHVQADANDTYTVWGSDDGQSFRVLGRVEIVEGVHGLRSRQVNLGGVAVRYLRIGEGVGDNFYSLSEVQAFCQLPSPWPPQLQVVNAPAAVAAAGKWWNDLHSRHWEFFLAVGGAALLYWGYSLKREGRPNHKRKLRDRLLALMGIISALTYINFGSFHFGNFIHGWDTFHYYVGAKYFRELSYDRLYECVAVADSEDPRLRRRVELRKMTNLRTNALETSDEILKHPENCKSHFTEARWQAFKHDVGYFRSRESPKRWDDTQTDHGYNATPVWNVAGSLLANTAPASETQIFVLNLLDPAYYVGMMAVIWWAFGWRTLSVGMLAFATFFPSRFYWTGGAYLRWDWLFYTVASVCCLKKGKPLLGGLAIGYAALLRIFPGFVVVGPLLATGVAIGRAVKARGNDPTAPSLGATVRAAVLLPAVRPYLRYFLGGILAVALLVPISLVVSGGPTAYKNFVANTIKHKETPLTNYMGMRTVIGYRPSEVGRLMRNDKLTDPWKGWKDARLRAYNQGKPLTALLAMGFLVLIGLAVARHPEPWVAAALGSLFIAIGVELTCYYYAFIIIPALLWEKREEVGWWLLVLTAFSEFASFAHEAGFMFMPSWLDEQYTLISAATVVAFTMIVWLFGPGGDPKPQEDEEDDDEPAVATAAAGPTGEAPRKPPGSQRGGNRRRSKGSTTA